MSKRSSGNIFHPSNERRLVFAHSAIGLANLRYPLSHNQMQIPKPIATWSFAGANFSSVTTLVLVF